MGRDCRVVEMKSSLDELCCPICTRWFCTEDHDLDGMNAVIKNREAVAKWRAKYPEKNRAKVAKWQRENRDKVNAKQRRYHARKRETRLTVLTSIGDK